MKNFNNINKILFIDDKHLYLFVYNIIKKCPNLLFTKFESYDKTTFKTKLLKILTIAGNFLGFNIKNISVIINDPYITIKNTLKQKYNGNVSKSKINELLSSINGPQLNNLYLNKIIFNDWMYDDKNDITYASYITYWTKYDKTNFYINSIFNECHLSINSIDNLYLLNNQNKCLQKNVIKIVKDKIVYQQYDNGLLRNINVKYFDENKLLVDLAKQYSTNVELIKNILQIIKSTNFNVSRNINLYSSFNLQNNAITTINIEDLLTTYKRKILSFVKEQFSQNLDSPNNDFMNISNHILDFDFTLVKSYVFSKLINSIF